MIKIFDRELTLEQVRGFVTAHEKDGEIKLPTEWVLELIQMAKQSENKECVAIAPIFEYNCVQIDGVTLGGCPVCPTCNEPAYEKDECVFCGQKFKMEKDLVEVIRCKQCKHFTDNIGDRNLRDGYCNRKEVGSFCKVKDDGTDYCSYAISK